MTHTEEAELDQQLSTAMEEGSNSTTVEEEHQRQSRCKWRQ